MTRLSAAIQAFGTACLAVLLISVHVCVAQESSPQDLGIAEKEIVSLQTEFNRMGTERGSSTSKRRAAKKIVRSGEALIAAASTAPNRFRVLAIILDARKRLFGLENSARNREAIFETCDKLAAAPDAYADLRLEADMLLMEKALTLRQADVQERAAALAEMIQRYRDTPGEAKSLMIASQIAPKLEAFELEKTIISTLTERFQGDRSAIEFRRSKLHTPLLDVLFVGTFTGTDGGSLSFPMDRLGQTSLLYFWSQETPDLDRRLAEVKALQARFPGQFEVFSFNLDELSDAGEKILRTMGLDWTALHLPGGRENPAFRTYVQEDPGAVLVNAQGHALLTNGRMYKGTIPLIPSAGDKGPAGSMQGGGTQTLDQCLDGDRYRSQLQSLFIGDFLARSLKQNPEVADSVPAQRLEAIQACFSAAPMRYRLSREQSLANYREAERLCRDVVAHYPEASDLWLVRNHQMIALLGMWNLATEPKHLANAVAIAEELLGTNPHQEARVVPQFCIAKAALRSRAEKPKSVLAAFMDSAGGNDASGSALAAAALLSLDANARDSFAIYQGALLDQHSAEPTLWPVTAFLRDRHHRYRFFRATHSRFGFTRAERHAVGRNLAALDEQADTTRVIEAEFTTLEGSKLCLPQDTAGKLTLIAFMELPADEESAQAQDGVVKKMISMAGLDVSQSVKVITAFLSDDKGRIKALVEKNEWTCQVAIVPDGIRNPLVRRLGILSADRMPNVFLLRGDGSISWSISGLTYPVQGSTMTARIINAIDANVSVCQMEAATGALDQGDLETAIRLFSEAITSTKIKNDWWATFRLYGRARAHMALKAWEVALADIDAAMDAHSVFGWGKPHRCDLVAELQLVRAEILDQLGRSAEAAEERKRAAQPTYPHNKSPFGLYTEGLEHMRLSPH